MASAERKPGHVFRNHPPPPGRMVAAVAVLSAAAVLPGDTAAADPGQDEKFFDLLGEKDIPAVDNANSLIETAHKVCSKLDGGMSVGDLVDLIRNNGYNENPLTAPESRRPRHQNHQPIHHRVSGGLLPVRQRQDRLHHGLSATDRVTRRTESPLHAQAVTRWIDGSPSPLPRSSARRPGNGSDAVRLPLLMDDVFMARRDRGDRSTGTRMACARLARRTGSGRRNPADEAAADSGATAARTTRAGACTAATAAAAATCAAGTATGRRDDNRWSHRHQQSHHRKEPPPQAEPPQAPRPCSSARAATAAALQRQRALRQRHRRRRATSGSRPEAKDVGKPLLAAARRCSFRLEDDDNASMPRNIRRAGVRSRCCTGRRLGLLLAGRPCHRGTPVVGLPTTDEPAVGDGVGRPGPRHRRWRGAGRRADVPAHDGRHRVLAAERGAGHQAAPPARRRRGGNPRRAVPAVRRRGVRPGDQPAPNRGAVERDRPGAPPGWQLLRAADRARDDVRAGRILHRTATSRNGPSCTPTPRARRRKPPVCRSSRCAWSGFERSSSMSAR